MTTNNIDPIIFIQHLCDKLLEITGTDSYGDRLNLLENIEGDCAVEMIINEIRRFKKNEITKPEFIKELNDILEVAEKEQIERYQEELNMLKDNPDVRRYIKITQFLGR